MAGETGEEKGETLKLSISASQAKTSVAHPVGPHGKNILLKEDILDWDRNIIIYINNLKKDMRFLHPLFILIPEQTNMNN